MNKTILIGWLVFLVLGVAHVESAGFGANNIWRSALRRGKKRSENSVNEGNDEAQVRYIIALNLVKPV